MTKILSREEIKSKMQQIAEDAGFKGTAVDFIISIMATGYSDTLMSSIGLTQEAKAETAVNINSLISLACDRMYSAYRGKNPRVIITGISTEYQVLKRGTQVYSSVDYNLYVENDTVMLPNIEIDLQLVVSKNYYELENSNKSLRFYTEYRQANLSEDFLLFVEGKQTETTKVFRDHVDLGTIFALTIQDFGVRFYTKQRTDDTYLLSAFEYISEVDLSELYNEDFSIQDFTLSDTTEGAKPKVITGTARETIEELRVNYNSQIESLYLIRSKSDLTESFRLAFASKATDVNFEQDLSTKPPKVNFYYIPRDESNKISDLEFNAYATKVRYYYLYDDLVLNLATKIEATLEITLVTNEYASVQQSIQNIIDAYQNKLGTSIEYTQLRTDISKIDEISNVVDMRLKVAGETQTEYTCDPHSYLSFTIDITVSL